MWASHDEHCTLPSPKVANASCYLGLIRKYTETDIYCRQFTQKVFLKERKINNMERFMIWATIPINFPICTYVFPSL